MTSWCRRMMALLILAGSAGLASAEDFSHAAWDRLLKAHVVALRQGQATQLDYAALATQRSRLKEYLVATSAVTQSVFDGWPKADQLAFLINAYNAWTAELVLTVYPQLASIKDLGSLFRSPWQRRFIPLLGATRSLDDIEHDLIRGSGRYNDPRIHFAVNCASVGCPALRSLAYVGAQLDGQLEEATNLFLSDRTRNRVKGKSLEVSSIFKWYRGDFESGWRGAKSLAQFLALYRLPLRLDPTQLQRLLAGEMAIDFLDYDWQLNDLSPQSESGRS